MFCYRTDGGTNGNQFTQVYVENSQPLNGSSIVHCYTLLTEYLIFNI